MSTKKNNPTSNRILFLVFVLFLVVLIAVIVIFSIRKTDEDNNGSTNGNPTPELTPSPTPTPTPVPSNNWSTFTNEVGDISFPYPESWTVVENLEFKEGQEDCYTKPEERTSETKPIFCKSIITVYGENGEPAEFKIYTDGYWAAGITFNKGTSVSEPVTIAGEEVTGTLVTRCRNNQPKTESNCETSDVFFDTEINGRSFTFYLFDISEDDIEDSGYYTIFKKLMTDFQVDGIIST